MKEFFKMFFASVLGVFAAGIILCCIFLFITVGIVVSLISSGKSDVNIRPKSILRIDVESMPETASTNPWETLRGEVSDNTITLTSALKAIEKAKNNKNIAGIYIDMPYNSAGMASMEELRRALLDFKKSGKFIYSYADQYSQKSYYLASVADSVFLNPQGTVELTGLASTTMFYKEALKKIGIDMLIFRVGTYKGAVEPFMLDKLSDANRYQIQQYLDGLWGTIKNSISASRKVPVDSLQNFADKGASFGGAEPALSARLVDALTYRSDFEDTLRTRLKIEKDEDLSFVSLAEMNRQPEKKVESDNEVRVIYASGTIVQEPFSRYTGTDNIDESLSKDLHEAMMDDDVKAVVLRVNSPGGSAYTSEQIWYAMKKLKEKKPVVVSMGDVAASGGYYISCVAGYIFAEPNTLTGSIGIFGRIPNMTGLAKKIGLTTDAVSTAKYAAMGSSIFTPMTDDEKGMIQHMIERGYQTFLSRVAEGRLMSIAAVDSVGQGRVWLGSKAVDIGLVDELGGLDKAIAKAASMANVASYYVNYSVKNRDFFEQISHYLGAEMRMTILRQSLTPEEIELMNQMRVQRESTGILARLPLWFTPL